MKRSDAIINKYISGMPKSIRLSDELRPYVTGMMQDYAREAIALHKQHENKEHRRLFFIAFGYFSKLSWNNFILKLRARSLKWHKKATQKIANEDHRKYYIIRNSEIGFKRFSSADIKYLKSVRVMGKDVDIIKLHETADAIIYPQRIR